MSTKTNQTPIALWPDGYSEELDGEILWSDFIEEVQSLMKRLGIKKFFAYGTSLTWRNIAGYTEFETDKAEVLVNKLLPQTSDFRMAFYPTDNAKVIEVVIWHHDKPFGETMWLMSQTMEKKLGIKEEFFCR